MKSRDKGKELAKYLFPELTLTPDGRSQDALQGIDAKLGSKTIQIKYDSRISGTSNIYHEIYEKTDFRDDQPWRSSLGKAKYYLFLTKHENKIYGFILPLNKMAEAEAGLPLTIIKPNGHQQTSMGFLFPLSKVKGHIEQVNSHPTWDIPERLF